jgi:hypothetical protein
MRGSEGMEEVERMEEEEESRLRQVMAAAILLVLVGPVALGVIVAVWPFLVGLWAQDNASEKYRGLGDFAGLISAGLTILWIVFGLPWLYSQVYMQIGLLGGEG